MDIVDIILAKALTPQALAQYMAEAQSASAIASEAALNIESITEQTNTNNENAQAALEAVTAALDDITTAVNGEIDKIALSKTNTTTSDLVSTKLIATFPSTETEELADLVKYYTSTGNNTDGTMTQKAISDELSEISYDITNINSDISDLNGRVSALEEGGGGGGSTYLGTEYAGKMVVVGDDGYISAGNVVENDVVNLLIKNGEYQAVDALGLQVDYENKSYMRIQEAAGKSQGASFDDYENYSMYCRARCNVNNNGQIVAWHGESGYKDDGSNGQVMVYQPKFYYSRVPLKTETVTGGTAIRRENIIISDKPQAGFKLHPLFKRSDGIELDYVLLSAYEGSAENDANDSANINFATAKLASVAGAKPISGVNKQFTVANAEQMAQNRGSNWHIMTMAAESAQQMLQLVEYGSLNGQASLETGISYIPNNSERNCASLTGSTASLGNSTGHASTTRNEINGVYNDYTDAGKRAISYRGFENPWGNIWRMIGGMKVTGNGSQNGGIPYICTNYNYSNDSYYNSIGFQLPSSGDWISAFGLPSENYDWVFMPIECSGANSAVPVGDSLWTTSNVNRINVVCIGGQWYFELTNGMFFYGCDQSINTYARSYSARLMYIPEKGTIYTNNINSWKTLFGSVN